MGFVINFQEPVVLQVSPLKTLCPEGANTYPGTSAWVKVPLPWP
jgi:hypothetical protein